MSGSALPPTSVDRPSLTALGQLLFGVFCCATSVLFIKSSTADPVFLASARQLLAAAFLAPWYFQARRAAVSQTAAGSEAIPLRRRQVVLPGLLLGAHFVSWIVGARLTPAANATLIVNMVPIAMPFLLLALAHERVTRRELVGTGLALGGVIFLGAADFDAAPVHFLGDLVCFGSMLLYAGYLAGGRAARSLPSLFLYVVPVYFAGGLACLVAGLVGWGGQLAGLLPPWVGSPATLASPRELLLLLGLTVMPTLLGHTLINRALRSLRGQVVSIVNLAQFVFAGLMAWFFLGERPAVAFLFAAALVVAGALVVLVRPTHSTP